MKRKLTRRAYWWAAAPLLFMSFILQVNATTLSVLDYGVVGDGSADDSANLQAAFADASTQGATLLLPADHTIRITKNLFISGSCNIIGSGSTSIILCDEDLALQYGRQYWISVGITEHKDHGGVQKVFSGTLSNFCLKASSNAKFQRCLFVFNTTSLTVSNLLFDFCSGTSQPNQFLFGAIATGANQYWQPPGHEDRENITISDNRVLAKHCSTDSEGISVASATNVLISNNYVKGVGDDPIAGHGLQHVEICNNECYSLDGRILVMECLDANIHDNYCERMAAPDGSWLGNGAMIMAGLETGTNSPAPTDIMIVNNTIVIPSEVPTYTYGIRIRGGRTVDIASNRLVMNSTAGGGGIRVEDDTSIPGWTDTTGQDPIGIARPHTISISKNICEGAYPGSIEESGTVDTLPGPFLVRYNQAGGYFWYTQGAQVEPTNHLTNGDYSTFKVPLSSLTTSSSLFSNSLQHVKPNILTVGSPGYTAIRAGRIVGFTPQFTSLPSGGWLNVKLLKSGTEVSSSTVSTNQQIILDRTNPQFAYHPGDTFTLEAIGSSGLQPTSGINLQLSVLAVETSLALFYTFDGTAIGDDASGNNNSGAVSNGVLTNRVHDPTFSLSGTDQNPALALNGSTEITVPDKACLHILDNLSICFWINPTDYPTGYAGHVIKKSSDATDSTFDCYYFGTTGGANQGKIEFLATAGGLWTGISAPYAIPQNQWTHVALVYTSAAGGQLYINGVPKGSLTGSGPLASNTKALTMGTGILGKLDQVRVYNRALSGSEIAALYTLQE